MLAHTHNPTEIERMSEKKSKHHKRRKKNRRKCNYSNNNHHHKRVVSNFQEYQVRCRKRLSAFQLARIQNDSVG